VILISFKEHFENVRNFYKLIQNKLKNEAKNEKTQYIQRKVKNNYLCTTLKNE